MQKLIKGGQQASGRRFWRTKLEALARLQKRKSGGSSESSAGRGKREEKLRTTGSRDLRSKVGEMGG